MTTLPALKPILDATLASFAQLVEHDAGATVLPNLLDVVQEVGSFVATLGRAMIQTYLDGGMIPVATLEPIATPEGQEPERTPVRHLPKRHRNCRWEEAKLGLVQVPGESGHRSVVQVRLQLAGTWWHPDNVKNILALRMIKANGWWAEYWAHRRQLWRKHADELRSVEPRTRLAAAA